MSVFIFIFFMYQNAKTREYYSIWERKKKKTLTKPVAKLPETCHLGVLSVLGSKTLKKQGKHTIWENKITLTKSSVFELFTYQNDKRRPKQY